MSKFTTHVLISQSKVLGYISLFEILLDKPIIEIQVNKKDPP